MNDSDSNRDVPLFSILIPTHDRAHLVSEAIDSALAQNHDDFEVIVLDDGSTDSTMQVLDQYGDRIRTIHQTNQGAEVARNNAAAAAKGRYLVFLDSDDALFSFALDVYAALARELDSPPLIVAKLQDFQNRLELPELVQSPTECTALSYPGFLSKKVRVEISYSCLVIDREFFRESGGVTPGSFPLDDIELMLRTGCRGPCAIIQSPPTAGYRWHDANGHRESAVEMADAIKNLLNAESAGDFPGGRKRCLERWAYIGGIAWSQGLTAYRKGHRMIAIEVWWRAMPCIVVGVTRKILAKISSSTRPISIAITGRV